MYFGKKSLKEVCTSWEAHYKGLSSRGSTPFKLTHDKQRREVARAVEKVEEGTWKVRSQRRAFRS